MTAAALAVVGVGVFSARLAAANVFVLATLLLAARAWKSGKLAGQPWARCLVAPLVVFAAISFLSALWSLEPSISLGKLGRLLVFFLVPAAAALLDDRWWPRLVVGVAGMATVLAVWGIIEYSMGADSLQHRIQGPLSHYMTYSGWLLLAVLVLVGQGLLGGSRWIWLLAPASLGVVALLLSYTRNAWVGLGVGLLLLAAVWRRRLLLVYPVVVLAVWALFPRAVVERAVSMVDLRQEANYDRLCMVASGVEMVRDHPWLGVGPDMVKRLYPLYRRDDAPRWRVPHLHNNALQIAAERGLPALGVYLWLLVAFFTRTWRSLPSLAGVRRAAVAATLIAVAGITAAGLFEYNFWDAEVQYLTLVLMGAGVGMSERGPA